MTTRPIITFRPLDHATWHSDGRRIYQNCRFRSPYSKTVELLLTELGMINVNEVVIEVDVPESQVRNDGMLYARANPKNPRVRISFKHPKAGHLQYPCDTYNDWQDNIRAIAMTMGAQRAQERYGATRHNQQYKGWAALPPSGSTDRKTLEKNAYDMITLSGALCATDDLLEDAETYRRVYRLAAICCHPDTGGDDVMFSKLQAIKQVIDKHFGGGA